MRPEPQGVDAFIVMMGRDHSWEMPGEKGGRFSHVPLSEAPRLRTAQSLFRPFSRSFSKSQCLA